MLIDIYNHSEANLGFRNMFLVDPTVETASDYINEYFNSRSKGRLFNISFTDKDSLYSKSVHTVSAFLLGVYLRELVEQNIASLIDKYAKIEINEFEYPWFLACLYHDVFSSYEHQHGLDKIVDFKSFLNDYKIEHTIYNPNYPKSLKLSPFSLTYKESTIESYYDLRRQKNAVDHGILSGFYAFDRLTKNYLKYRAANNNNDYFETDIDGHTLIWEKNQIWIFALVSDAIIAHNIWHEKDAVSPEITLEDKSERKLNIVNDPLAFYLSLIDTIEPVKYFYKVNPKEILENIYIEYIDGEIIIGQSDNRIFNLKKWYKDKMENMGEWLKNIESDPPDNGIIKIRLL